jgi:hypothetical protein
MSYSTTSGFSDLVGSCEISNNNVTSYTSNSKGAGTVTNLGGSNLNFRVSFSGVTRPYVIVASANPGANGFSGNANNDGPEEAEETWAATATAPEPVPESAYAKGE